MPDGVEYSVAPPPAAAGDLISPSLVMGLGEGDNGDAARGRTPRGEAKAEEDAEAAADVAAVTMNPPPRDASTSCSGARSEEADDA